VRSTPQEYKMLRVREEDYEKLRQAQRLIQQKGLESIDWGELRRQSLVEPPPQGVGTANAAAALTLGFVIGVGAAAIAALVARHLAESEGDSDE
jgi:hypothetical protein